VKPTERSVTFQLIAIPLIILFIFTLISTARKLNDKSPGLVIGIAGIIENSSFFPVGLISWGDVVSMYIKQYRSTRWLMIEVRDPEQYFSKDNFLTYAFQRLNQFIGGSSIFISSGLIDVDFDEMVGIINQYYEKYGRA
jgi:hypothetical protein